MSPCEWGHRPWRQKSRNRDNKSVTNDIRDESRVEEDEHKKVAAVQHSSHPFIDSHFLPHFVLGVGEGDKERRACGAGYLLLAREGNPMNFASLLPQQKNTTSHRVIVKWNILASSGTWHPKVVATSDNMWLLKYLECDFSILDRFSSHFPVVRLCLMVV